MKKMIEEGTLYDEMTPEQKEMHEEIKSLIDNLETLSAMWSEMIEYNNPKFGNYKRERQAGFQYKVRADIGEVRWVLTITDGMMQEIMKGA